METKQFAEFVSVVVRQLPRDLDLVIAQRWIRDQEALGVALRKALSSSLRLYLTPSQVRGEHIIGLHVGSHLKEMKLFERTFSPEDEVIKGWIANPSTYPNKFKEKSVFLWNSERYSGGDCWFAFLVWKDDHVSVDWRRHGDSWGADDPILLTS